MFHHFPAIVFQEWELLHPILGAASAIVGWLGCIRCIYSMFYTCSPFVRLGLRLQSIEKNSTAIADVVLAHGMSNCIPRNDVAFGRYPRRSLVSSTIKVVLGNTTSLWRASQSLLRHYDCGWFSTSSYTRAVLMTVDQQVASLYHSLSVSWMDTDHIVDEDLVVSTYSNHFWSASYSMEVSPSASAWDVMSHGTSESVPMAPNVSVWHVQLTQSLDVAIPYVFFGVAFGWLSTIFNSYLWLSTSWRLVPLDGPAADNLGGTVIFSSLKGTSSWPVSEAIPWDRGWSWLPSGFDGKWSLFNTFSSFFNFKFPCLK